MERKEEARVVYREKRNDEPGAGGGSVLGRTLCLQLKAGHTTKNMEDRHRGAKTQSPMTKKKEGASEK